MADAIEVGINQWQAITKNTNAIAALPKTNISQPGTRRFLSLGDIVTIGRKPKKSAESCHPAMRV